MLTRTGAVVHLSGFDKTTNTNDLVKLFQGKQVLSLYIYI